MFTLTLNFKRLYFLSYSYTVSFLCIHLATHCVNGQETNTVNYTTTDGLPSSQVYDIIQDDYGYLWFSTDKGLCRHDGYTFENYTTEHGLPDPVVFDFHKRPNGEIWCTTNSARLFKITGKNPSFSEYKFNDTLLKYAENQINHGVYFHNGISFSYHHSEGFLTISENGTVESVPNSDFDYEQGISCVIASKDEPFFYWDNEQNSYSRQLPLKTDEIGMYKHESYSSNFEAINFGKSMFFGENTTFSWIEDGVVQNQTKPEEIISSGIHNSTEFWVGYRYGGVEVYSKEGRRKGHYLKGKSVTQLYQDHEKNLWISTLEHGVFKIPNAGVSFTKDVFGEKVTSLETNGEKSIFIGLDNGSIVEYSGPEKSTYLYRSEKMKAPVHMAFLDGVLYFSSDRKYQWHQASRKTELYDIGESNYIVPYKGKLIHGIGHTVLGKYDHKTHKGVVFLSKRMYDVAVYQGKIYGANANGLYVSLDVEKHTSKKVLGDIRINDLNVFNQLLVLGTNGEGLIILDSDTREHYHITTDVGLNSDFISKTYSENDSILWVCTNKGINKITFTSDGKYQCKGMTTEEGLLSNEVWDLLVKDDTVWVGTQRGLNYFSTRIFDVPVNHSTNYFLQWTDIEVKNGKIPKNHVLAYDQNELTFYFKGISFHSQKGLIYRYRLRGLHNRWRYTTNTSISFSALPPGTYELILQVKGDNDSWNDNKRSFRFTIQTPFWKRWWFILFTVFIGIGLLYLFFKVRILTYNRDIVREMLIYFLRKIRREQPTITIKYNGKQVKLITKEIHFVKTDGNYLEIYTKSKKYFIRSSLKSLFDQLPDSLEFIQVHRSYVVRLEHIQEKGAKQLVVLDQKIPVGRKYQDQLDLIKTD